MINHFIEYGFLEDLGLVIGIVLGLVTAQIFLIVQIVRNLPAHTVACLNIWGEREISLERETRQQFRNHPTGISLKKFAVVLSFGLQNIRMVSCLSTPFGVLKL